MGDSAKNTPETGFWQELGPHRPGVKVATFCHKHYACRQANLYTKGDLPMGKKKPQPSGSARRDAFLLKVRGLLRKQQGKQQGK